jgi:hypothetical protein
MDAPASEEQMDTTVEQVMHCGLSRLQFARVAAIILYRADVPLKDIAEQLRAEFSSAACLDIAAHLQRLCPPPPDPLVERIHRPGNPNE